VAELEDAIKNKKNTVHETADVIYHLLVTLESAGINFDDIITELKKREGTSGFEEKKNCIFLSSKKITYFNASILY